MALPHKSIATINSPQFINLQPLDINPLMSACEIKVLYIGENRNRSFISKQVAIDMAKTLRGAPIVGYYREQKQDFTDHGEQVILDDEGIHFNCLTKPYGFVAPDAKIWFQKFNDYDQFGNSVEREYLMTTGFLWTGQYEEVKSVLQNGGKPHSMELQEESLEGHWATNINTNIEFFIINDATFTKLCILGDDTEPCFEGSSITAPEISKNFSKSVDENFKKTLYSMINELKDALKGGNNTMAKEEALPVEEVTETFTQEEEANTSEPIVESTLETSESTDSEPENSFEATEEENQSESESETETEAATFTEEVVEGSEKQVFTDEGTDEDEDDDEDQDETEKYSLLEQQYNDLSAQYTQLKTQYDALVEFKNTVENERKDALINEFYMLSDEDKKDIIENKSKYSLEEIKAKLAVICYDKKVNFSLETSNEIDNNQKATEEEDVVTYNYNNVDTNLPDWVKAVKQNIDDNN